jgi:hypothetical protein
MLRQQRPEDCRADGQQWLIDSFSGAFQVIEGRSKDGRRVIGARAARNDLSNTK